MVGFFSLLVVPALVDSTLHNGPVLIGDPPDKEHLDVVFDRDELRVVDPRFPGDVLAGGRYLHGDWFEAKLGLLPERQRLRPLLIHNSVLVRFDAALPASLVPVCQDGSMLKVSVYMRWLGGCPGGRGRLHASTMALVVSDDDEAAEPCPDIVHVNSEGYDIRYHTATAYGVYLSPWFRPHDLEDLR